MGAIRNQSAEAFMKHWESVKEQIKPLPRVPHPKVSDEYSTLPHDDLEFSKSMSTRPNSKKLGPEFASLAGKEDASIHNSLLDNPKAEKAFQDSAIRRAVARGMSSVTAQQLFGNKASAGLLGSEIPPRIDK